MTRQNKQTDISNKEKGEFQKHLDKPVILPDYTGAQRPKDRVALITGGDSGIGRAVAVHFAREGADVAIAYLDSDEDADETRRLVEAEGRRCLLQKGDVSSKEFCTRMVQQTIGSLGKLNILVNNAGTHQEAIDIRDISEEQLMRTFSVNVFSQFYSTQAALGYMGEGDCVINTASVTAYRGSGHLLDYSATKGAIVSFTRSLSQNLASKKIRVNAVAPGPVWTPLVVYSFDVEQLRKFGKDAPLGRAGYPYELAPAYVYLASDESAYVTGQTIHVNGGDVING